MPGFVKSLISYPYYESGKEIDVQARNFAYIMEMFGIMGEGGNLTSTNIINGLVGLVQGVVSDTAKIQEGKG